MFLAMEYNSHLSFRSSDQVAARRADSQMSKEVSANVGKAKELQANAILAIVLRLRLDGH